MNESNAVITLAFAQTGGSSAPRPVSTTNILLIERDEDCVDALEVLLAGLPRVRTVRAASTAQLALADIKLGHAPDIILLGSCADTHTLVATIQALRAVAPSAAIVLLSLYPEALSADVAALADAAISKDTRRVELMQLLAQFRGGRLAARGRDRDLNL
jgi:DNA-binding NarL/FixJ family response regulator